MNKETLVIRAKKHAGTITTVASFFSRKNIAVEQMFCSTVHGASEIICSVTYLCDDSTKCMLPHISKMHDVLDVYYSE